jgi:tetratricopeptide (TPR) repeat protein
MPDSWNTLPGHAEVDLIGQARADAERLASEGAVALQLDHAMPDRAMFPGYEVLEEVHRGAQGVVYRALCHSTAEVVAIKVIRSGAFAGRRDAARFAREVSALGRIEHPNVVAIRDSGVVSECPYLVMDFVDGPVLDVYMANASMTLAAAVDVFIKICDAVTAAHLRGIIHRDLKPSNVRVDRMGAPRVLDFGLAKFTTSDRDERPELKTSTGQFIGSLPWASPEQADGRNAAVDVRSDVYSMGVMFYQMLSGRMPYGVEGGLRSALDTIVSTPPAKLVDTRWAMDDDLVTIVMTCLKKSPQHRYQSASDLARELRRYRAGEPIHAKRNLRGYMMRKWINRNRATAVVTVSVLAVIVGGFGVSLFFWKSAVERSKALAAEREAAMQAQHLAMAETLKAERVSSFLTEMLTAADPVPSPRVTVRDVLAEATSKIGSSFDDQPEVAAALRKTIGEAYQHMGLFDEAEEAYRAAIRDRFAAVMEGTPISQGTAALLEAERQLALGHYNLSEQHFRDALALSDDESDSMTAQVLIELGSVLRAQNRSHEAGQVLRSALDLLQRSAGDDHPTTARAKLEMARVLRQPWEQPEAQQLIEAALNVSRTRLGEVHAQTAETYAEMARQMQQRGDLDEATALLERVLARVGDTEGDVSARILEQLGTVASARGELEAAEHYQRQAIDVLEASQHSSDLQEAESRERLSDVLMGQGRFDEAESVLQATLENLRESYGSAHPHVTSALQHIGKLRLQQGRVDEAEVVLRDAVERQRAWYGDPHRRTVQALSKLADVLAELGRTEESLGTHQEILSQLRNLFEDAHPAIADAQMRYGEYLHRLGDYAAAENEIRAALDLRKAHYGETQWPTAAARLALGETLAKLGRLEEALAHVRSAHDQLEDSTMSYDRWRRSTLQRLARVYETLGHIDDAARIRSELAGETDE